MERHFKLIVVFNISLILLLMAACSNQAAMEFTPTASPYPSKTASPTASSTPTLTPSATLAPDAGANLIPAANTRTRSNTSRL